MPWVSYPGCSPDGKFVYYVNRHRPQKLWKVSTDGGAPLEIGTGMGEGVSGSLDVSPDGKMLSYPFDQYRPMAWKIAVIPASGGPAVKIFDAPGGANRVRWSPAGTSLQFAIPSHSEWCNQHLGTTSRGRKTKTADKIHFRSDSRFQLVIRPPTIALHPRRCNRRCGHAQSPPLSSPATRLALR